MNEMLEDVNRDVLVLLLVAKVEGAVTARLRPMALSYWRTGRHTEAEAIEAAIDEVHAAASAIRNGTEQVDAPAPIPERKPRKKRRRRNPDGSFASDAENDGGTPVPIEVGPTEPANGERHYIDGRRVPPPDPRRPS